MPMSLDKIPSFTQATSIAVLECSKNERELRIQ